MSFRGHLRRFAVSVLLLFLSVVFAQVHALPELNLAPFADGTIDGSEPFGEIYKDPVERDYDLRACADPASQQLKGDDCSKNNGVVRTQDTVAHIWSVKAIHGDPTVPGGEPIIQDVIFEQILTPSANADVNFERVPVVCTENGDPDSNPASSIVKDPATGVVTLTCNLGPFTEGQQKSFTSYVKASGSSHNGSDYTSTQRVYSPNPSVESVAPPVGPIKISAAPAYDLSIGTFYDSYVTNMDIGNGLEKGWVVYGTLRLAAGRKAGVESITQPITFDLDLTGKIGAEDGAAYQPDYKMFECTPNTSSWGDWGREVRGIDNHAPHSDRAVLDSGDCSYTRADPSDTKSPYTITIDNADLSGDKYPTRTYGGSALTAGPYYVIDHRFRLFFPFRTIDAALYEDTDKPDDLEGQIWVYAQVNDFDPVSISGTSNYGDDVEPGYNGQDMGPTASPMRSNNINSEFLELYTRGSFAKYTRKSTNDKGDRMNYLPGQSSTHSGDSEVEPGHTFVGWVEYVNNGTNTLHNPASCDVFDNSTQKLVDRSLIGATAGKYAFVGERTEPGFDYNNYIVEYGHVDLSADNPLDKDNDGQRDFNSLTGRYEGDWSAMRAAASDCGNDALPEGGWQTSPEAVPGGVDAVNIVRARWIGVADSGLEPAHRLRLVVPLQARNVFYGGQYDNQEIPVGTVLPDMGSVRSDEWSSNWLVNDYQPSPENSSSRGDRTTLARIQAALDSESLTPKAASGSTATTLAGKQIVWKLNTTITSGLPEPSDAKNLQIINVLPPEVTYNPSCTAEYQQLDEEGNVIATGTPASLVEYNTDKNGNPAPGYTRLIWNFGDVTANTAIPPRIICTDSDSQAPNGRAVVNYAEIRADNVISSLQARSDTHTISLEQSGSIQVSKQVDIPLDDLNDEQVYTLKWANFAKSFPIKKPTVIDVFSYNGDAADNSLSKRSPASRFHGQYYLKEAPTVTWKDGSVPGTGDDPIGVWRYTADEPSSVSHDSKTNTSNWCLEADFGSAGCPAGFSQVTAIRFDANYELEADGHPRQGMEVKYTMVAGDAQNKDPALVNKSGDIYTNRFGFGSDSLQNGQYLTSNNVSVQVVAYSIGDIVFADVNNNGKYDAGIDGTVPNGVVVELYKVEDDGSEAKVAETTTGILGAGRYLFGSLASGRYYVKIPATEFQPGGHLEDWTVAPPTGSGKENDDHNEDVDQHGYTEAVPVVTGVRTGTMTLSANPPPPGGVPTGNEPTGDNTLPIVDPTGDDFSNLTLDIGLKSPLSSIGNMVWVDANNNGLQDVNETGLSNVTVKLLDGDGNLLQTTRTDNNGYYNFSGLAAGDYLVEVTKPAGYEFSPQNAAADDTADSDVDTTTGRTTAITIPFGQHDTQWDAGLYPLGSIGDQVWIDNNNNGVQDPAETIGISGVNITLKNAEGNVVGTTTTDGDGHYLFTNLPPGDYIVDIDDTNPPLDGYSLTTANEPYAVTLAVGEDHRDADFGYVNFASVGDRVWHDLNGNGVQDEGEPGIPGVTVRLLDTTGGVILDKAITDDAGNYRFSDVVPGDYVIEFVKPNDYQDFVTANATTDAEDSDATPGSGRTAAFTLAAGEDRSDMDAGLYRLAALGNFLWLDENGDNLQTAEETGLAGVSVTLSGTPGNGETFTPVTVVTDENGHYQFTGLYPGDYTVTFDNNGFVTPDQGSDDTLDSDAAVDGRASVTLASGDDNQTLDAGIAAASVTGRVWIDNNTENAMDDGTAAEQGVVGVTVKLIDPTTGEAVAMTTTGGDGLYSFTGVKPGSYLIEVVEPANMGFVKQDQGDDLSDSDVNPATGRTEPFTLNAGQHVTDLDAGIEPGSLGDHVALDLNNNGIQDAGEPGVEGIVVKLLDSSGTQVATQTTDATGFYNFTGVLPGNYTVHFEVPVNMSLATADAGSDDTIDFDPNSDGNVAVVVVSGEGNQTIDAGIVPATLGDTVWFDKNGNGVQDTEESGVADILVTLVDAEGNAVVDTAGNPITTTTDSEGIYSFSVLPGTYGVKFTLPEAMAFTTPNVGGDDAADSDADPDSGLTQTVTVNSGDINRSLDAGIVAAVISGTVLSDSNGNGTQEAGDTGVGSVVVTLSGTDLLGQPVELSTTTDENGAYQFNVMPGTYTLSETNPAGTTSSGAEQGSVGSTVVNNDTIEVTVKGGETSAENDFLDYQPAELSGQVRNDQDGDADLNTTTDPGIAGVEVMLWRDSDGNGTPDVVYANTTTNADGAYRFTDLPPGDYVVIEADPESYASTADSDNANDNRISVTLTSGESSPGHDFLDTLPANISGQVRDDDDRDADLTDTEKGIAGVTLTLYTDPNGDGNPDDGTVVTTTVSDAQGNYQFNNVLPGDYVVVETDPQAYESMADVSDGNDNRVPVKLLSGTDSVGNDFLDASQLGSLSGTVWTDSNVDGVRDAGSETGIPNVTVLITGPAGNVVKTLTTDANGYYEATDLPAGNYTVTVVSSSLPEGSLQTGDPDSSKDHRTVAAVVAGESTNNLDFGYMHAASVGDTVWHDLNANGIQDEGEPGVANVAVKLLDSSGNELATTTTNNQGDYQFDGLSPGDYQVVVVKPDNYLTFSEPTQGGDLSKDSDITDATTGKTAVFSLAPGEDKSDLDAGLLMPASLGDTVWFDTNGNGVQDADEPGVAGVDVTLTLPSGAVLGTQTTDHTGQYRFEGLAPGNYNVTFDLPTGMSFTAQDQGEDDAQDSDVAADGRAAVTLTSGQSDLTLDAGVLPAEITGRVWIDNNTQNALDEGVANEDGVVGVNVNLIDTTTGNAILTTTTGADGIYNFTGVPAGEYVIEVVEPANMGFVTPNQGSDDTVDSDVDVQTGRSPAFTVHSDDSVTDIDAGIEPGELGDRVWLDENNNGVQDSGEPGVAGVTVNLIDRNGNADTRQTDDSGFYNFTGVLPADYTVNFTLPTGMNFAEQDRGTDDTLDSDVNVNNGNVAVTVVSGVGNQTLDAGVIPATIGDKVWFDANGDGLQDETETALAGVTVKLLDGNGHPVKDAAGNPVTTLTDADGLYNFTVLPGTYAVEVELPQGAALTQQDAGDDSKDSDADPATRQTASVTVNSGDHLTALDAGVQPATISGSVITDNNGNGTQDADDTVQLPNVTLTISGTDVFGNEVTETVTTDADGNYTVNLPPGTYTVTETTPTAYTSTGAEPGTTGSNVVDADNITVTVNSGETSANNDFLERKPASLSGQVRDDSNGDGDLSDTNDAPVSGVTVFLWSDNNQNGTPDAVVANTTTDSNGEYQFTDLAPGHYIVVENDAPGFVSTADTAGDNDNQIAVTLQSGEHSPGHDYLDTQIAGISGQVRDDEDRDGDLNDTERGIAGVTIELYTDPNGDGNPDDGMLVATDSTDTQGNYQFNGIVPGNYVVVETDPEDYESTTDTAGDNDNRIPVAHTSAQQSTGNDFLDASQLGSLSGVVWSDTAPDGTQQTGEGGIPNATVRVKNEQGVVVATLTTDANGFYQASDLPAGNYTVEVDSSSLPEGSVQTGDPDQHLDHSAAAVVVSGENTAGLDFGYVAAATLGDTVWEDLNGNSVQDNGEPGIAGVAVKLSRNGEVIATTTTNGDGQYQFNQLIPGDYTVNFTTPNDFHPTTANAGTDDTLDSDMDAAGNVNVTLASADDLSVDAGFYRYGELGNKVWLDWNNNGVQDADEPAVSEVTVNLLDAAGNPVMVGGVPLSTVTDAEGHYRFSDLPPGDYQVEFVAPEGISFVAADQGADDALDSDAQANGQAAAVVVSNQYNDTVDAGIVPAAVSGRVWIDNNKANAIDDGVATENGVVGVTVNLIDHDSGQVVATTTTGADGAYNFTTVLPGNYVVEVIEPMNMELVAQDQGADDTVDSDFDPQTGRTDVFTLSSGNTVTSVDAGILPGALGDHVFLDKNENGLQDGGEPGIAGVEVKLIDSSGKVSETATTDETGFYDFKAKLPGDYTVKFVLPNGMSFTRQDVGGDDTIDSDVNPADGTVAVTVVSKVNNQTIDAGVIPAQLGDTVWLDLDGDGTQGGQEPPVPNVEVILLDAAGEPVVDSGGRVVKTTTDEQGQYRFTIEPGTYGVQFILPEHTQFTTADTGGNDAADSDADPNSGKTAAVTVTSGEHDTTLDAGIKPASISGKVLQDNNGDSAEDAADTALSGVTVTLQGTDVFVNPVQRTVTTDEQGNYRFDVPPGRYTVTETNPDTYVSSAAEPGTVGSTLVNTDMMDVVVASSGEASANNDFLDYQPASLSGQVREDTNGDADTTDAADPALEGVMVMLWRDVDADGTPDQVVANTTTDADGQYRFTDLPPGHYVVVETDPASYRSTVDTNGDNDNQIAVLLASGEQSPGHDFLDARPTTISGQVREDTDRDGNLTDDDQGLEGVTVTLYTDPNGDGNPDDGEPVQTTTTNPEGHYVFNNVMPGDYVIVEDDPQDYTSTADTSGELTDNRIPVRNVSGENNTGNDLLDTKLAGSVSGVLWDDENADGVRDPGEPVFSGVKVTLVDNEGNETTVQTDPNGAYHFPDLIPGDYTVVVKADELPENSQQTGDPDGTHDHQHTLTVQPQTDNTGIDFGYVVRGSIGDKVWHDLNANGLQEADEPGIAGVEVQLLDATGHVLATTETAANGSYQFSQLLPGDYRVSVALPAGYDRFSQAGVGSDDAADSDVDQQGRTTLLSLEKAQNRTDVDAGLYAYASVGNMVWLDRNDDDLQQDGEPGVENIAVTLTGTDAEGNSVEQSTTTDVNGHYQFSQLIPGDYTLSFGIASPVAQYANGNTADALDSDVDTNGEVTTTLTSGENDDSIDAGVEKGRIGDTVWEDLNGNGQQDDGEPGIPGAVVTLYTDPNGDGDPADGEVLLTTATNQDGKYVFDGLLPDDYVVVFTTPEGHSITTQNAGDDTVDSDINPQGQAPVTIHAGDNVDVDAGFWRLGSLGDRVWLDENTNGLQDAGEASVSDVTVSLYDLESQPVMDGNGQPYQTQTDENGRYQFNDLAPGDYQVRFVAPAGVTFSQTDYGNDDTIDSDANANGYAPAVVTSGQQNSTVDAGLVPAAVTGRVWIDNNERNGTDNGLDDEPGMVGIVVNLLDTDGNVVYSTTTGEDGRYNFAAVLPDEYQVEFIEPENIRFIEPNQGSDDALDSEADVTTGKTPFFTVESGSTITDVDAGVEPGALGDRVWLDTNENGIQDEGEPGVAGIPVHLLDGQSLTSKSTVTDENGFYSFTDVTPGHYTVKFERPAEMQFINPNLGDDTLDSDVDVNGAVAVTVQSGINGDQSIDAGIKPAFIGDRVWLDQDVNDLQSEGEPGLANITVKLLDQQGNVVDTTTTDADGLYQFAVVPGEYQVNFVAPDSVFSQANAANNDRIDSDADTSGLTHLVDVQSGERDLTLDAGILPALISGQLLEDNNGNGQQDSGDTPQPGTTVILTGTDRYGNPVELTAVTDEQGNYQFIVPPGDYQLTTHPPAGSVPNGTESDDPEAVLDNNTIKLTVSGTDVSTGNDFLNHVPVAIRGTVRSDQDGDLATTTDNQPLSGVEVALYTDPNGDGDPADGVQIATTTTDDSGNYQFNQLPPGNYVVVETDPGGMVSVAETMGSDGVDNDPNDNRIPMTLTSGHDSAGNDFFDAVPVTVSGVVHVDEDADGVYNTTDQPLTGVTVKLYTDPNGDGDPADGVAVQTVGTNAQGVFRFDPVVPGHYVVVESDPANYNSTAAGQQSGSSSTSDQQIPLLLASGDDQDDLYFLDVKPKGVISGQVQNDTDADGDLNDPDAGVVGVTVALWTDPNGDGDPADGERVASVVTDEQGNYHFDDVPVGSYVIVEQDKPGYVSTADSAQANDNRIPVRVSMDGEQHCTTPVSLKAASLDSCTGLDFVDRQLKAEVSLHKTAYAGHDQGAQCGTEAAKSEITLVDIDKDLSEAVTYCFEVTNTGESYLTDIQITDTTLNLTMADLKPVGEYSGVLVPVSESAAAKRLYYYEHLVTTTLENRAAVAAQPVQADGTPLDDLVDDQDESTATVYLVFDPPSGIKTVSRQGDIGMEWQMVWINSMPTGHDAKVTVYDEVPEGTHFTAMEAGSFVSTDGVYCEARGQSVTESCVFEQPSADYPRGRVVWTGSVHGDGTATNESEAAHEVVIRFVSTLDEVTPQQLIQNRASSSWDTDGDGTPEFEDVVSRAPGNSDPDAPTAIEFNQPGVASQIPTLSWWAMILMSLMMSLLVGWHYRRSPR